MSIRPLLIASALAMTTLMPVGCGLHSLFGPSRSTMMLAGHDPATIQSAGMGFADRYISAMADTYDKVKASAPSLDGAVKAQDGKVQAALGVLGNAVNPNPIAGLMDSAILVTLTRLSTEDPWAAEAFGREGVDTILAALRTQETDVWRVVGSYLTPAEVDELHQLATQWRRDHPGQQYLAGVRLASFPQANQPTSTSFGLAKGVFGILRLDPFAGLDPAVRQVEESRILGERVFFYMRHTSVLLSWQAQALYMKMLEAPQIKQALADTTRFSDNTTGFTGSTRIFADASNRISESVEKFRVEIPAQRTALVAELNELVARQRDETLKQTSADISAQREAALKQAAQEVAAERDAAINQLNAAVIKQQDLMAQNLQKVMDHSIDQLYFRARSLMYVAVGGLIAAVLLYGIIAALLRRGTTRAA